MWPRAAIGFVLTVAVSAAMYFFVERHMAGLRRRLHGRKKVAVQDSAKAEDARAAEVAVAAQR
jgi:peptidoglycan/LPS O-acetylase OafA/YrhL